MPGRIYASCKEAISESIRNLQERGIEVPITSYQDKNVKDDPDFLTKEIIGETFTITNTDDLNEMHAYFKQKYGIDCNKEWADAEFEERVSDGIINPGEAWKIRKDVWEQFLQKDGTFHYSYNSRIRPWKYIILNELKRDKNTRRAYLPIFDWNRDMINLIQKGRISCTLGEQFMIRKIDGKEKLHAIYMIRSNDAFTHFVNDVYLAIKLQKWFAANLGIESGHFTMFISSFHGYMKDIKRYNIF